MERVSDHGSHKKISNGLVALGSAAVLAVYTAGYLRTKSAADRFAVQAARRPVVPVPSTVEAPSVPIRSAAPVIGDPAPSAPAPRVQTSSAIRRSTRTPTTLASKAKKARRAEVTTVAPLAASTSSAPVAVAELPAPVIESPAAVPAPPPSAADPPKPHFKDGTYFGWGTSRHGDIQAQVVIESGRIASATIAQCLTRYSCSVIAKLPPQVAERQSPETDYVSGATQSTNAFYYAVVEALSKAK